MIQIEEMYSVPESFLEIEVRNPQTHGECFLHTVIWNTGGVVGVAQSDNNYRSTEGYDRSKTDR